MSKMRTARHQHVTAVIAACCGRVKCARIRKRIHAQMPSDRMGVDNLCGCRAKVIDRRGSCPYVSPSSAQVAELVDALASGASARKGVEVRVLSWAPFPGSGSYHCQRSLKKLRKTGAFFVSRAEFHRRLVRARPLGLKPAGAHDARGAQKPPTLARSPSS